MFFSFDFKKRISFILFSMFLFITTDVALHAQEEEPKKSLNYDLFNKKYLAVEEELLREQIKQLPEEIQPKEEAVDFLLLKKDFEFDIKLATESINQLDGKSLKILETIYRACLCRSLFLWQKKRKGDVDNYKRTIEEGLQFFYSREEFVLVMNALLFEGFALAKRFEQKPEIRYAKVQKLVDNSITKFKEIDPSINDEAFKFLTAYNLFIAHSSSATKFAGGIFQENKKWIGVTVSVTAALVLFYGIASWRGWFRSAGKDVLSTYANSDGSLTNVGKKLVDDALLRAKESLVVKDSVGNLILDPKVQIILNSAGTKIKNYIQSKPGKAVIDGRLAGLVDKLLTDEEKVKRFIATAVTATGGIAFNPEARGAMGDITHEAVRHPQVIGNLVVSAVATAINAFAKIKRREEVQTEREPGGEQEEQRPAAEDKSAVADVLREFLKPENSDSMRYIVDKVLGTKALMKYAGAVFKGVCSKYFPQGGSELDS